MIYNFSDIGEEVSGTLVHTLILIEREGVLTFFTYFVRHALQAVLAARLARRFSLISSFRTA